MNSHSPRMTRPVRMRASASLRRGRASALARLVGALMSMPLMLVPPTREAVLDALTDPGQPDADQADDQDHAVDAAGVEVLRGHHDDLTESGGAQEEFGRHHADEPATNRLPHAGHRKRQRVG